MNPPKLAIALLKLLVPGRDALAGDLVEQFRSGKSTLWLWREVVAAILTASWKEVQTKRMSALKAVALGWAAMLIFFFAAGDFLAHSADQTIPRLFSYLGANHFG